MKNKFLLALVAATILFIPQISLADTKASQSSASINATITVKSGSDSRVKVLYEYLKSVNSPLTINASDFVEYADKYNLDWRTVVAISGVESTFGKAIPQNSYNGWGWGVYGTNVIRFSSWKEGIKTVSKGIRERYMDSWGGTDIYSIGSMYAASPVWADHVTLQINRINAFALANPQYTLSLSY